MSPDYTLTSAVVVVGGEIITGKILELLLRSVDWSVRFLAEPFLDEPGVFDRVQLLLLAPGLSLERRESLLRLIGSKPAAERIPVLELDTNAQETRDRPGHLVVPWPCRTKDLKQQIAAALLAKSGASQDDRQEVCNLPDKK